MAVLERRSKRGRLPRPDGRDEVLEVRLSLTIQFGRYLVVAGQRRPGFVLPSEEHLHLVTADLHPALGAVDVNALGFRRAAEPVSEVAVQFRPVRILVRGGLRVWCLLIGRLAGFVYAAT